MALVSVYDLGPFFVNCKPYSLSSSVWILENLAYILSEYRVHEKLLAAHPRLINCWPHAEDLGLSHLIVLERRPKLQGLMGAYVRSIPKTLHNKCLVIKSPEYCLNTSSKLAKTSVGLLVPSAAFEVTGLSELHRSGTSLS